MSLLRQTVLEQVQATERQVEALHALCRQAVTDSCCSINAALDCEDILKLLTSIRKQVTAPSKVFLHPPTDKVSTQGGA